MQWHGILRAAGAALMAALAAALCGCGDGGYGRSGFGSAARWSYDGAVIDPVHPGSFQPIDARFARDSQQAYYRGSAIAGSHGPSFEVLGEHEARDRNAVYYADTFRKAQEYWSIRHIAVRRIEGALPASYRVLGHGYASDGERVYDEGRPFPVHDARSFMPLDARFARDALRGYFEHEAIAGSEGASFELIDVQEGGYARDARRVYFGFVDLDAPRGPTPTVRVLRGVAPQTLRVLGRGYASDGTRVFHHGLPLADADVASFTVLQAQGDADGEDRRGRFVQGRRQPA